MAYIKKWALEHKHNNAMSNYHKLTLSETLTLFTVDHILPVYLEGSLDHREFLQTS